MDSLSAQKTLTGYYAGFTLQSMQRPVPASLVRRPEHAAHSELCGRFFCMGSFHVEKNMFHAADSFCGEIFDKLEMSKEHQRPATSDECGNVSIQYHRISVKVISGA